jgi:predicted naringenin-chalcone synthase
MENTPQAGWNLTPIAFHNSLSFSEEQHMVWSIGNFGFEMKLSAYVPEVIRRGIRKLTLHMLEALHKTLYDVRHLAIHPGGKKILEVIETEIGVTREQNEPAYHVLRNFGNMSSPTVLFVLDYIIQHLQPGDDQTDVLGFAFGPGLTLESMLLTVIKK